MSTRVTEPALEARDAPARPPRRRRRMIGGGAVLAVVAAVAAVAVTAPSGDGGEAETATGGGTSLVAVQQGPLSSQVGQSGTLSYAAGATGTPYQVVNQAKGTYTRMPVAGAQIDCGETLYKVDQKPVILVCGSVPAYRDLSVGDDGKDVRALNRTLVDGGYAERSRLDPDSGHFGWATAAALEKLQDERGADVTGRLDLGQAVSLPGPLRIGKVTAGNGTGAVPGRPVMEASSNRREVVVNLDPSQQSEVRKGDGAQITLPDNRTTPGVVTRIGTVATSSGKDGADAAPATLPIYITLKRPKDAGTLDQAPVQVEITTDGVKNALSVPVTALLGRAGGGYEVEVAAGDGGRTRFVPVTLGLFDHANGRVQVSGALAAGDRVVVPST
ncbi:MULTISPECIES: efflux RND transporter periplasmic adaptor subunit [Actinomadura]|uniref:Multidrug efflux pump subunit AcrA (Membrane-fusion protein) n=1 Tax=Actinomadura madurae TaxID=1993 RepID=A0A1I5X327_9ACTN|nr:peptidoglycan-binding protein [Actinomadura madurae]SFQ26369.1 Multidrug efflux pump subunit AcrA (membrane-fusion protein) [Actinomadura madurae]SPT60780.1 efflux transporter, RND family, MFP subunit [Actinomadura madurae]